MTCRIPVDIFPFSGSITGCRLDDVTAFGGFFIVHPRWRKRGVGKALWDVRMKYLGDRNFGIDAVEARVEYDRLNGFEHTDFTVQAFLGPVNRSKLEREASSDEAFSVKHLQHSRDEELQSLLVYDTKMHVIPRVDCMKHWINPLFTNIFIARSTATNDVIGYGCIQPMEGGHYHLGPVFADSPEVGKRLMTTLFSNVPDGKLVGMDAPVGNQVSMDFAKNFGWSPELTLRRMYTKKVVKLDLDKVFTFTTMGIALV